MLRNSILIFMSYILLGAFFYFFLFSYKGKSGGMDDLEFYSENLSPFNYIEDGKPAGLAISVLDFILRENNSRLSVDDVNFYDWSRSYFKTLARDNAVLFSTTRSKDRENLFKWAGPIAEMQRGIFAKPGNEEQIKAQLEKDLGSLKFAVAGNTIDENLLIRQGVPKANIQVVPFLNDALKLLMEGKVDAIACNDIALNHIIKKGSFERPVLVKSLGMFYHYFAFNKNVSDDVVRKFQEAIDRYKEMAEYKDYVGKVKD